MDILTTNIRKRCQLLSAVQAFHNFTPIKHQTRSTGWLMAQWLIASLLILQLAQAPVQAQGANESEVKAAYLFNFAKFVEWPNEAFNQSGGALVFGVLGDDALSSALEKSVNGKNINGHQLAVRRLKGGQQCNGCQILFIGASERKRVSQIIDSLRGASVLTIGDFEPLSDNSGIINFVLEQSKLKFVINNGAAEQVRLRISAKLLALAKSVKS